MTKNKKQPTGYFFMAIGDGTVNCIYEDHGQEVILAAGFASAMVDDPKLFDIISTAFLTIIDDKEKYTSKKSNKVPKKVTKKAK